MYQIIAATALWALLLCQSLAAQNSVSGSVASPDGLPLSGAHIAIEHSMRHTFSAVDGTFNLGAISEKVFVLRISHLGYATWSDTTTAGAVVNAVLDPLPFMANEVVVSATRLSPKAPGTFQNIEKQEIERLNMGQDFPFLIGWTPSIVVTSDAGAGVGYTGIRIRGSDQTRINVTVNGIPINDPESQGVFWVNMPDLASSMSSVQIQRGLGTSTNGSGAFGASINIATDEVQREAGAQVNFTYGSFNTWRRNVQFQTGKIGKGFWLDGRLSAINSDGFIDRAESNMSSYFMSGGFINDRTMVKAVVFSGKERTFQSWYGTPQSRIENDVPAMIAHAQRAGFTQVQLDNLLNSGRTYNFYLYENEVDDYGQDHYQLHLSHAFRPWIKLTGSLHYTYGSGFFEQFRENDQFADYGLPEVIIGSDTMAGTDMVRRRWLDNHFYGGTYALNFNRKGHNVTLGGGIHLYRGDHFGEVIWASMAGDIAPSHRYYFNYGNKDEFNNYLKWDYTSGRWMFMAEAQLRIVGYETAGIDNDRSPFDVSEDFVFFNPKAGARYALNTASSIYGYAGIGNREPVRNDFVDALPGAIPVHETLFNFELGYTCKKDRLTANVNGYLMNYYNQLVLTGQLNDVGASVRSNVDNSYRVGIEGDATFTLSEKIVLNANLTLSENKIRKYVEVLYDYTDGFDVVEEVFTDTEISFSPSIIGASTLIFKPLKNSEMAVIAKYVGEQYLDNTQQSSRSLDAFSTIDVKFGYVLKSSIFKEVEFSLLVNNIFNAMYSSNGYTYSYIVGDRITENFFYPQAGINFLTGITLRF